MSDASSRLFVGTFLSPEQQKDLEALSLHKDKLHEVWQRKIRFVRAEKLHLTWMFLGSVEKEAIPDIASSLSSSLSGLQQTQVAFDKIELWPSAKKARLLVLGAQTVTNEAEKIATTIRQSLTDFTADHNERHPQFRPHITLVRLEPDFKSFPHPIKELAMPNWLETNKLLPMIHEIKNVSLIESHLGSPKEEYEIIADFPLVG